MRKNEIRQSQSLVVLRGRWMVLFQGNLPSRFQNALNGRHGSAVIRVHVRMNRRYRECDLEFHALFLFLVFVPLPCPDVTGICPPSLSVSGCRGRRSGKLRRDERRDSLSTNPGTLLDAWRVILLPFANQSNQTVSI